MVRTRRPFVYAITSKLSLRLTINERKYGYVHRSLKVDSYLKRAIRHSQVSSASFDDPVDILNPFLRYTFYPPYWIMRVYLAK
jgi:hypothetical protein